MTVPLRPTDLYLLLVLEEHDLHGYGMMKAVERLSDGAVRIDIGSLYRVVARIAGAGLVEPVPDATTTASPVFADERRRYYRITTAGRRALKAELTRLKSVVALASARGLLASRGKSR